MSHWTSEQESAFDRMRDEQRDERPRRVLTDHDRAVAAHSAAMAKVASRRHRPEQSPWTARVERP